VKLHYIDHKSLISYRGDNFQYRPALGQNITDLAVLPYLLGIQVADLFTVASKPEARELIL